MMHTKLIYSFICTLMLHPLVAVLDMTETTVPLVMNTVHQAEVEGTHTRIGSVLNPGRLNVVMAAQSIKSKLGMGMVRIESWSVIFFCEDLTYSGLCSVLSCELLS